MNAADTFVGANIEIMIKRNATAGQKLLAPWLLLPCTKLSIVGNIIDTCVQGSEAGRCVVDEPPPPFSIWAIYPASICGSHYGHCWLLANYLLKQQLSATLHPFFICYEQRLAFLLLTGRRLLALILITYWTTATWTGGEDVEEERQQQQQQQTQQLNVTMGKCRCRC